MKTKHSILIIESDTGQVSFYINGIPIMQGNQQVGNIEKLANCELTMEKACDIMDKMEDKLYSGYDKNWKRNSQKSVDTPPTI